MNAGDSRSWPARVPSQTPLNERKPEDYRSAAEDSLDRLFPQFRDADDNRWNSVINRAKNKDANALQAVDHKDNPDKHPVCAAVLSAIGSGKKGKEIREQFENAPYGWPRLRARATSPTIDAFPPPLGSPIHAEPPGHRIRGNIMPEQFEGANAAQLESLAPQWAHAHLRQDLGDSDAAERILKQLHFVASDELTGGSQDAECHHR